MRTAAWSRFRVSVGTPASIPQRLHLSSTAYLAPQVWADPSWRVTTPSPVTNTQVGPIAMDMTLGWRYDPSFNTSGFIVSALLRLQQAGSWLKQYVVMGAAEHTLPCAACRMQCNFQTCESLASI